MPRTDSIDRSLEILVVDDDPDVRELLVEYFRELEFKVASASDGRAAITAVERDPQRYWLVMTDIVMPGADGIEVLQAAKKAAPHVPVVIITGYASLDTAIEAVRLGAADYLSKPFSLGQIDVMIQRLTERILLEQENRELSNSLEPRGNAELIGRLDSIGARIDRIENLLRSLAVKPVGHR